MIEVRLIEDGLALPVVIIAGLLGVCWLMVEQIGGGPWGGWHIFLGLCALAMFGLLSFAMLFLIKTIWGFETGYVLSPSQVDKRVEELLGHYSAYKMPDAPSKSVEQLRKDLMGQYIEAGELNWINNLKRIYCRRLMRKFLVLTLVVFLISAIPLAVLRISRTEGDNNGRRKHSTEYSAVGTEQYPDSAGTAGK